MSVAESMRDLGIDKQNFRTLGLLPLVFVAWADGTMQRAEEALIRRVAQDKGWLEGSGESLLERWIREPPTRDYVSRGLALIKDLAEERQGFAGGLTVETLGSLLVLCKEVAEAAGGRWGLSESISAEEERALATIAEAFGIGDARTWRRLVEDLQARPTQAAPGPKGQPWVGELRAVSKDPLGLFMRCFHEYGDVVRMPMPGLEWYLISAPEHVRHVLVDHSRNYIRGRSYDRFRLLFEKSIVTTDGEQWRPLRRIAQPAFHRRSISGMGTMMVRCANDMVDAWEGRPRPAAALDVADQLQRLTLRIIGLALFSVDLQDRSTRELSEAVDTALEYVAGSTNPFRLPSSVPTPTNLRFARSMKRFESFILRTLAHRRESGEHPADLMSMILQAVDPETGEGLRHLEIRDELLTYLLAGHETTAATITWTLCMLSKHPVVARRLDQELEQQLGDREATVADLERLPVMDRIIKETLRLYPPAYMLPREVVSEDRIGGYTIPAKAWVLISPYVTHRRPDLWPNPEGFDPERFTPEAVRSRPAGMYFPFFVGPHKCIGEGLAMMESKLVLATVWRRCRLELMAGFEPQVDAQVTLRARDGLMMHPRWRAEPRADSSSVS